MARTIGEGITSGIDMFQRGRALNRQFGQQQMANQLALAQLGSLGYGIEQKPGGMFGRKQINITAPDMTQAPKGFVWVPGKGYEADPYASVLQTMAYLNPTGASDIMGGMMGRGQVGGERPVTVRPAKGTQGLLELAASLGAVGFDTDRNIFVDAAGNEVK